MPGSAVEEIRHQVAIAGSVTDAVTGRAILGALVELVEHRLQTLTREDGWFYFTDLPVGTYTLTVAAPTFGSRYQAINGLSVMVQNSTDGRPIFDSKARVQLQPTTLVGRVTRADTSQPIPNAIVQLSRSEVQTTTNPDGRYVLSGLQKGSPTVQATAKGFSASVQKVVLITGQETTANFSLTPTG